ncbi:MAG: hypothetical protein RLZZ557_1514 [Bacteroidota bacterium]|jgi:hypothetical protein
MCYTIPVMKKIFKLLILAFASLISLIGLSKKEKESLDQDAIRLPEMNESAIVEDYELAAYHNQA